VSGRGFLDLRSPVMRPVAVRAAATAICLGWAAVEAARGHLAWALIFSVAGLYLVWALFIAWDPAPPGDETNRTGDGE